jgi:peptidoglycan/xylan/chitin deacetylase (PgdA/CDA1 family)
MTKSQTWVAAGGVALGVASFGAVVDRQLGTRRLATVAGVATAGAYLAGAFFPHARIFGKPVELDAIDGLFALTFDDGPDPRHTLEISRVLAERGHRATFFVLGRAVRAHPEIAAAVVDDGHELACHGDDHRLLAFALPREIRRQISAVETAVVDATGARLMPLFRAPHGVRSPWLTRVVGSAGYRVCAWDGAVFDTAAPGVDVIVRRVERLLCSGAIVLLHDGDGAGRMASRRQTVDALPPILDAAESSGLRSVGLGALLGLDRPVERRLRVA